MKKLLNVISFVIGFIAFCGFFCEASTVATELQFKTICAAVFILDLYLNGMLDFTTSKK